MLDRKDEAGGEESWQGIEVTNKYYWFSCGYIWMLVSGRSVICFQRIEEAVAGLKECEAEVDGVLRKMERGGEAVSALKSKVR